MITTVAIIIIFILSITFPKLIHKYNYFIYALAGVIALIFSGEDPNIINLGYIPLSFMIVVMYTGIFQKGFIKKRLMTVRAENAIIGIILLIPHSLGFLEYFLDYGGFFDNIVPLLGVSAFILAIPLFITSFQFIRKKFKYTEWKYIHKLAYPFYMLLFLHLAIINNDRLPTYLMIFGLYFILKYYDSYKVKKKPLNLRGFFIILTLNCNFLLSYFHLQLFLLAFQLLLR